MKKETENDVRNACLQYLTLVKRWWAFRTNNTPVYDPRIKRYRAFTGEPGMADIYALHDGVSYWVETKKPGGKQSEEQKTFERNVKLRGGVYLLVESVEQLIVDIGSLDA